VLQIDAQIPEEKPPWLQDLLFEHGLLEPEEEEPQPPPTPEPELPPAGPEPEGEDWVAAMRPEEEETVPVEEGAEVPAADDWLQALREAGEDLEEAAEPEEETTPFPVDLPAGEEELPSWLRDLESLEEEEPAPSELPADEAAEEIPDWLQDLPAEEPETQEEPIPPAAEPSVEPKGDELPDWLRDLAAPQDLEEPPAVVEEEASAPAAEVPPLAAPSEVEEDELPEWLRDLGGPEEPLADEGEGKVPPLREAPDAAGAPEKVPEEAEEQELPEWLRDLRSEEMEQEVVFSPTESAEGIEAPEEPPERAPEVSGEPEVPEWLQTMQEEEQDGVSAQEAVEGEEEAAAHPDWLTRPTTPEVTVEEGEVPAPEWLQGPVPADMDESEEREDAPPDWLQDLESETPALAVDKVETVDEVPPWLDEIGPAAGTPEQKVSPFVGDDLDEMIGAVEESPVEDAPPEPETPEGLVRADIPEWLLALRPDQAGEEAEVEIEELSGPLKGIRGVLPAEPIIAKPHLSRAETVPVEAPTFSGDLFAEVVAQPPQPAAAMPGQKRSRAVVGIQRVLIYLLILAAVVVPLFIDPFQYGPLDAQDLRGGAAGFYPLLEGTGPVALPAGSVVVVAFDYQPAMAGELSVQAQAVVDHLMARDLRIAAISLYPEGAALALDALQERADVHGYEYGTDYIHLGYLPNQPASVRHFLDAGPLSADRRDYLSGRPLDGDQYPIAQAVRDMRAVSLVVELTGDERTLRTWVEQITAHTRVPIAAGVSASIAPYAQPYLDSGQLEALLVGLPGAAEYEARREEVGQGIRSLGSQVAAQAMVVLLIFLGNLVHLVTRGGKS
jgi:hypothetical protein